LVLAACFAVASVWLLLQCSPIQYYVYLFFPLLFWTLVVREPGVWIGVWHRVFHNQRSLSSKLKTVALLLLTLGLIEVLVCCAAFWYCSIVLSAAARLTLHGHAGVLVLYTRADLALCGGGRHLVLGIAWVQSGVVAVLGCLLVVGHLSNALAKLSRYHCACVCAMRSSRIPSLSLHYRCLDLTIGASITMRL
jgi:hypothetical protein